MSHGSTAATARPGSVWSRRTLRCPSAEEPDSWKKRDRGKLHLTRPGDRKAPVASSDSAERTSRLDEKPVALCPGLQHMGKVTTDDLPRIGNQSLYSRPPDSTGVSKSLPVCQTQAGKRADIVSLRKHLGYARRLASSIKRGQSYFHLLQKEEQEEQEEEERRRMRREEQLRTEPRPPRFSSDSDSDSEGWCVLVGTSCSGADEARPRRKKRQSARPFTPIHHSLTSPRLSQAPREVIYRQLCCLNWLLEALTLDRSGRVGPLTACWDSKDPGRGKTTIKTLKKERTIEKKWEQFISTKPQRAHPKHPRSSSAHLYTYRKSSFMSVTSLLALTSTTVGSSLSSLVPGPDDDTGTPAAAAAEKTDRLPSKCLPTRSNVQQSVKMECQGPRTSSAAHEKALESKLHPLPQSIDNQTGSKTATTSQSKSWPAQSPSAISDVISSKASMLQELRAVFKEKAEEMAERYVEILELKARERLNTSLQRYRALCHMTESHQPRYHVTCKSQGREAPISNTKNKHNMWLFMLLSSLPEEVCKEQAVSRVMQKLSGFAEQQTIRVRPQLFLKVLGGLEVWELCLPELCVAIQIALEHVVQMSREEYDAWLFSRVTLAPQYHCSPRTQGEPHSRRPLKKTTEDNIS
ncbi:coiled-coil domain-containing protein 60-like isoform X2 [Mastacembelus armatus]|uniref:coiled-coil domain-containing protein 60-like isoform X2 n=1 Tax=Mastacembelus armatus TaxID=205130 RepID=UPI000E45E0E8|nr:coiled-coil domain-containing protein 60 isoform X2 [Mastacembelus armatus]